MIAGKYTHAQAVFQLDLSVRVSGFESIRGAGSRLRGLFAEIFYRLAQNRCAPTALLHWPPPRLTRRREPRLCFRSL